MIIIFSKKYISEMWNKKLRITELIPVWLDAVMIPRKVVLKIKLMSSVQVCHKTFLLIINSVNRGPPACEQCTHVLLIVWFSLFAQTVNTNKYESLSGKYTNLFIMKTINSKIWPNRTIRDKDLIYIEFEQNLTHSSIWVLIQD